MIFKYYYFVCIILDDLILNDDNLIDKVLKFWMNMILGKKESLEDNFKCFCLIIYEILF